MKHNTWEKEEDLENVKEVVAKFERRLNAKIWRQKKLDKAEKRDFRKRELPEKFMARMLYGCDDRKFEEEYLKKLERNWQRWKTVSPEKKPWRESNIKNKRSGLKLFLLSLLISIFLYSIFRIRVRVTRPCCHTAGHIRWHSHMTHGRM